MMDDLNRKDTNDEMRRTNVPRFAALAFEDVASGEIGTAALRRS
jgi:hypothetical protein